MKFVHDNVGALGELESLFITYVFEFVGQPHVSLILINTFVVHSAGVNENDNAFELSVHVLHPFVEYATAVLGDGVAVSFMLHVVLADEFVRVQFAYTVHVNVGAAGAAVSTPIVPYGPARPYTELWLSTVYKYSFIEASFHDLIVVFHVTVRLFQLATDEQESNLIQDKPSYGAAFQV